MAPSLSRSLGCKSVTADDVVVHRPSSLICCTSSDAVKAAVPSAARKKKKKEEDTEPPRRPFLATTDLPMRELPEGHSSRRAVEIIFVSGWTGYAAAVGTPEVEAVFDVRATPRADAAFEEARAAAQARAGAGHRCAIDGNETMRFQCRDVETAAVETCRSGVRTFSGSGAAHARVGGRVMLVCRVIAGHMRRHAADDGGDYDSVEIGSGGELVVLDSRGVLPRYLVVYKVKPKQMTGSEDKVDQLVEYADAVTSAF